jgi:hypothetical protein
MTNPATADSADPVDRLCPSLADAEERSDVIVGSLRDSLRVGLRIQYWTGTASPERKSPGLAKVPERQLPSPTYVRST